MKPARAYSTDYLAHLRSDLARVQPNLHLVVVDGDVLARGTLTVNADMHVERFRVEILIHPVQDGGLPVVRELDGRIPRTAERHMNADGTACIYLPEEYFHRNPPPLDPVHFISGPVHDYFLCQAIVDHRRPWPHGEWAHGDAGRVQFFKEVLGVGTIQEIHDYLWCLSHAVPKGHWPCPCGSRMKLRNCHLKRVVTLQQQIPPRQAKHWLDRLDRDDS